MSTTTTGFILCAASALTLHLASASHSQAAELPAGLVGTWTLAGTDVVHKDGTEVPDPDYGTAPKGLMMIDAAGHYSTQIFKADRTRFTSGDKTAGTPAEYKSAIIGASTHFGTLTVDKAAHTLSFSIENAVFPNWEGQRQTRSYTISKEVLRYSVPPRPNGDTPVTIWRRIP